MGALDLPDEGSDETGADDGFDDHLDDPGFVPDPAERTWRHPSEIAAANAHAARYEKDAAGKQTAAPLSSGEWNHERVAQPSYRLVGTLVAGALLAGFVVFQFQGPRTSERALPEIRQLDSDLGSAQATVQVSTTSTQPGGDELADERPAEVTTSQLPAVRSGGDTASNNWDSGPQRNVLQTADRTSPTVTIPGVYGVRVSVPSQSERVATAFREWGTTIGIRSPRLLTTAFSADRAEAARSNTASTTFDEGASEQEGQLLCSGVAIGDYVLTSSSAIGDHETVLVDVGSETVVFTVAGRDAASDLAVLVTKATAATKDTGTKDTAVTEETAIDSDLEAVPEPIDTTVELDSVVPHPDPESVEVGDWVGVVAGAPHNAHTGTLLATSEHSRSADGADIVTVMSTSAVLPSNAAGGAIVDDQGRVIGIIVNDERYLASGIRIDGAIEVAEAVLYAEPSTDE